MSSGHHRPLSYGRHNITDDDLKAVVDVLKSDFLTQGPAVEKFEKAFAEAVGAKYAIATSNGTTALHLCALALDVNEKTNVLTSPVTFVASANCISYCGGQVDFVDINEKTYCMDPIALEKKILEKPKGYYSGVIPVHLAGYAINTEELKKICDKHGLWILEDACHAPGAEFKNSSGQWIKVGSCKYSALSIFSFHPVKHITTGEGGMITTDDEKLYKNILTLRTHGIVRNKDLMSQYDGGWYYEMQELGWNYRLPDVLCALGASQVSRLAENVKRRREIADYYNKELKDLPVGLPFVDANSKHAYHLYVILTPKRLELYNYLKELKIYTQVHYIPVYKQPYYKNMPKNKEATQNFPAAELYYEKCLSLPMYPELTKDDLDYVVNSLRSFYKTML